MNRYKITSLVSFVLALLSMYKGYDKMTNYVNSDITATYVNAYVGGDCYNYTINAQYATSYFIIMLTFVVIGVSLLIINAIKENKEK